MIIQNSVLNERMEINWSALRARMVVMAPNEKVIYLESMIREIGRIKNDNASKAVFELKEMQKELSHKLMV